MFCVKCGKQVIEGADFCTNCGSKLVVEAVKNNDKNDIKPPKPDIQGSTNVNALIKRAFLFLEDSNWNSAHDYFEAILDIQPENSRAYLGKMMAELHINSEKNIPDFHVPVSDDNNFIKAVRFANKRDKSLLLGYNQAIINRIENERKEKTYKSSISRMQKSTTEIEFKDIAKIFKAISGYKDADEKHVECIKLAEVCRIAKENEDKRARLLAEQRRIESERRAEQDRIEREQKTEQMRIEAERNAEIQRLVADRRRKTRKKGIIIATPIFIIAVATVVLFNSFIIPEIKYKDALQYQSSGQYDKSIVLFEKLGDYKDCPTQIDESNYLKACLLLKEKEYLTASGLFLSLEGYKDSTEKSKICIAEHNESIYIKANSLMENKKYDEAIELFTDLNDYKDSGTKVKQCNYMYGCLQFNNKNYKSAVSIFSALSSYKDSKTKCLEAKYSYVLANKSRQNSTTTSYLNDLIAVNYQKSKSIFNEIFKWNVEITVNDSECEFTEMSSISKFSTVYFHVKLSGGPTGDSMRLKYTVHYPDGSSRSEKWDYEWSDGTVSWVNWWYDNPYYASSGTSTCKIFNADTGALLGSHSVRILDY